MQLNISSYYENSEIDLPDMSKPILVTSAGRSTIKTLAYFDTIRPAGRRDYQMIFVRKGCIHYKLNGMPPIIAKENSILIYKPFTPQYYTMYLEDKPDVHWVHFTGYDVERIFKELNLPLEHPFTIKKDNISSLYSNIMFELTSKEPYFSEIANSIFLQLIYTVCRNHTTNSASKGAAQTDITKIAEYINANYSKELTVAGISERFNISASWLNRLFRQKYNMSLKSYITATRIEIAKSMLSSSNDINEIAFSVGYNDALYFSRIFHRTTGVSPSQYRKRSRNIVSMPLEEAPWNNKPPKKR